MKCFRIYVEKFRETFKGHTGKEIKKEWIQSAREHYAKGVEYDEVVGLYDTSAFGKGKSGLLFTDNYLYWKVGFSNGVIRLEDITDITYYDEINASENMVKILSKKGYTVLANAFLNGNHIYGNIYEAAAIKTTAKMLRGNMITGIASVVVLSSGDIADIFRGRISGSQFLKNVANTTATAVGGTVGWVAGSLIPIPVIGSIAVSMIGDAIAGKASSAALDHFVEDDADGTLRMIETAFVEIAMEYLLTEQEVGDVADYIGKNITEKDLKDMYASDNREYYARMLILPYVERKVSKREHIKVMDAKGFKEG